MPSLPPPHPLSPQPPTSPSPRLPHSLTLLLIFTLSLLAFIPNLQLPLNVYDEGLVIYGALRTLNGEMPYRDFWTIYAPGQFYTLAGVFQLFGASIIVERFWDALMRAGLSTMMFGVARQLYSGWLAGFVWLVAMLWLTQFGFHSYPMFPALLLGLVSILLVYRALVESRRIIWLLLGGIMAGLATLFRHDFGIYLILASGLALVLSNYIFSGVEGGRSFSFYIVGIALILTPIAIYFSVYTTPAALLDNLFIFPATIFPAVRTLPYPYLIPSPQSLISDTQSLTTYTSDLLGRLPFTIFPLMLVGAGIRLYLDWIRNRQRGKRPSVWLCWVLMGLGFMLLNQVRIRSDAIHLMPSAFMAILLMPYAVGVRSPRNADSRSIRSRVGLILIAIILLIQPIITQVSLLRNLSIPNVTALDVTLIDPDLADVITYIKSHSLPTEAVFVGLPTHDRIFINDALLYFLVNRPSATRYHELHPGVATTAEVQREIIADLIRPDVRLIIINHGIPNPNEPNESSLSSGITLLDDFIRDRYQENQRFGRYAIWMSD